MGIYYTELLDVLLDAGCQVAENATTDGWQHRARSSGGFPNPPLGVWWHHTASSTSPANDLAWMIDNSDDAPIGNMLIDRDGRCWPIAAGASNCAGKGGPWTFSRGTCPQDSGNTRGWQIEVANSGTGEHWPEVQVNAFFRASNAMNARFGNRPGDVVTHNAYAPDRKIDPATANAVQGAWRPSSCTSSGTWSLSDIYNECNLRAGAGPAPGPDPSPPEDDMTDEQASQLNDLFRSLVLPMPGNTDPNGTEMGVNWTTVYGYRVGQSLQQMIAKVEDRLTAIEAKLD